MLTPPPISIATHIDSLGIAKFSNNIVPSDWVLLIGDDVLSINRTITLYLASWDEPEPALNIDYPSVIFILRGKPTDYSEIYNIANKIKNTIHSSDVLLLGGDKYTYFTISRDIEYLPPTESKEVRVTFQLDLVVESGDATLGHRNCS